MGRRTVRIVLGLVALVGFAGVAIAAQSGGSGRVGPALHTTGNGRLLLAPGRFVTLGQFPTGGALTADGRFYWTVSAGEAPNHVRIVNVALKYPRVIQTLPLPGASGGIAIDGKRGLAYVSGVADSSDTDQMRPHLRGRAGDVIHVFRYNHRTGWATEAGTIAVPPPTFAPVPQSFPPKKSGRQSWPDRLAVSPNGRTLLVPLNLADAAAVVEPPTRTRSATWASAAVPMWAAILRRRAGPGWFRTRTSTVSVIALSRRGRSRTFRSPANLSPPQGVTVDPDTLACLRGDCQRGVGTHHRHPSDGCGTMLSVERARGAGECRCAMTGHAGRPPFLPAESAADELVAWSPLPVRRAPCGPT